MKPATDSEKRLILEEVTREFPNDRVLQEIHYSRNLRLFELRDLPLEQRISHLLRKPAPRPRRGSSTQPGVITPG